MKTLFLDSNYMIHTDFKVGYTTVETDVFDNYCDTALENIRYIPKNASWTRQDGLVYYGPFIQFQSTEAVNSAQKQFALDSDNMMSLADVAELVELVYQDDMGVIEG